MRCTTIYRPGQVVSSAAIRRETLIPVSQWLATLHVVFPVFLVFLVFLVVLPTERLTLLSPTPYTKS